jgi:eukaryotic-like serine/threonine-protein kinase
MTAPTAACPSCGTPLLPDAAFCQKCGAPTGAPVPPPDTTVLERLTAALADRYRIERELGKGGMATVFLAHDLRHERDVAIKVLHPELAADLGADRFEREIRVSAKLQHPHILSLFDSGTADGLFFYVMPFVKGESLRDRLDRENMLPVDDAIGITLEVADALGHAHGLGIVHRDIKPENIMLSGGHALVTDFGIARAVSAAGDQKLTRTGTAVGTPLYMSPEQAYGDEVGPTSDLYSLACVAYEMLTGQPPFTGSNARAIMARHTMEAVPGIRVVRDAVPEEVEEAILAALAKVPADRPKTAAEFATMLGTPLGSTTARRAALSRYVSKPRVTAAMRRVPLWRRVPVLAGAGAVILLGAVGAWYGLRGRGHAADAGGLDRTTVAVLYFEDRSRGGELGYLADGLTEGLIGALHEVRELKVISASGSGQYRGSSLALDSIARALGAGTLVRGSVEQAGANVRVTVRLVEGNTGADFGEGASIERPASEALTLVDSLVQQVAGLVRTRLGEGIRVREQQQGTHNADAWVLVQRAERSRKLMDSAASAGDSMAVARFSASADSLLALAERADARWADPTRMRGLIAYRRSRLYVGDPSAAGRWIQAGLGHVGRALSNAPRDPDALELRGNLRYWRWLLGLEADPVRGKALLDSAKADLELATTINPAQAGAWATLSHLYYNDEGSTLSDVNIAARRALEEDAFLSNADVVLQRLFFSSYDLGQFPQADQWCRDGHRRFPANPKFLECQLWVLTTSAKTPDPALAHTLADSLAKVSPERERAFARLQSNLLVAAVLARAGRSDSASALARVSTGDPVVDPSRDLTHVAAFVYTLLGDTTRAVSQLKTYLAANPTHRQGLADDPGWWFRPIAAAPAFRQLVGSAR